MTENNPKMTELRVKVRTEVLEDFKDFVTNKYGKLHSVLSIEVERALELYPQIRSTHVLVDSSTPDVTIQEEETSEKPEKIDSTTDNTLLYGDVDETILNPNNGQPKQPRSTFFTNVLKIRKHFENTLHMDSDFEFHPTMIKNHIRKNIGGDDRTVKKYIDALKPYLVSGEGMCVKFDYNKFDSEWV